MQFKSDAAVADIEKMLDEFPEHEKVFQDIPLDDAEAALARLYELKTAHGQEKSVVEDLKRRYGNIIEAAYQPP